MVHYKVGDYIRIKKREGDAKDYPLNFLSSMASLAGKKYEIREIKELELTIGKTRRYYNGDNHSYYLKNMEGNYEDFAWHSSMFEPYIPDISESKYKVGDTVIIASIEGDKNDYPFCFAPGMSNKAGEIYIIDGVEPIEENIIKDRPRYNGDSFGYILRKPGGDTIAGCWHSSMFESKISVGDSVIVAGNKGVITEQPIRHTFYVLLEDHPKMCEEINHLPYVEDLVNEFHGAKVLCGFPEFNNPIDLLDFIEKLNFLYRSKEEYKQTTKTSQNYEIGLQKSKASLDGGSIRRRGTISFERCKARIV